MTHPLKTLGLICGLLLLVALPATAQDDGRINTDAAGAPVLLFCDADGYVVRDLSGQSILSVPFSSVPAASGEAIVIASNSQADLYRAVGSFLQLEAPVTTGQKYVFRWPGGCVAGTGSSSFLAGSAGLSLPVGNADASEDDTTTATTGATGISRQIINLSDLPVVGPSASVNVTGLDLRRAGYGITNYDILTLRTGAGAEYLPLALMEGGIFVNVTGRNSADTWLRVETANGFVGWLRASGGGESGDEFIIRRGNLSGIPVVPESEMGTKAPATLVTSRTNSLYTAARSETVTCEFPAGEYIVNGSNNAGDWLQLDVVCADGSAATGWVQDIAGALRNPSGGLLPIIEGGVVINDDLQFIEGPAFLFFLPRTLYGTPDLMGDILCEAAPNRYAIVGRTQDVTWYEIDAVCLDGTTIRGWLQSTDGLFQTTNSDTVPVTG